MKRKRRKFIFKSVLALMCFVTLGYLAWGELALPSENQLKETQIQDFSENWMLVSEDGTQKEVSFPYETKENVGKTIVLEKVLGYSDVGNQSLMFWNRGNTLRVYVDGELRENYDTSESRAFGSSSPYMYIFTSLKGSDAGKTVRLEMDLRNSIVEKVYMGERLTLLSFICKPYMLEMIFAIIVLVLAMIGLLVGVSLQFVKVKLPQLLYFSLATVIACVWMVTNSAIRQFFLPNVSVARDIAFFAFALFPIIFAQSLDQVQNDRYHLTYHVLRVISCAAFWFMVLGFFFDFAGLGISENAVMIANGIVIFVVMGTLIRDLIIGKIKEYRIMAIGFAGLAVMGFIQALMYMFVDSVYTGVALESGLAFGLLAALTSAIMDMININTEKNDAIYANKARGAFLANTSHEIRTPINAILGMDEMILREASQPEVREYAENIRSAGTSLLSLINDILDFSKIDSGKMDIKTVQYQLFDVVEDLSHLLKSRAEEKNLKFVIDVEPHTINCLCGDDVRIKQVITNLLTNAIKYTQEGTVTLKIDSTRLGGNELTLHVSVIDTGMGIKKEEMYKLTEAFQRVDEIRNRNIEGTGLGLNITSKLLNMMGSELKIESVYGKGSTFSFDLKQEIVDFAEYGSVQKKAETNKANDSEGFVAPGKKILAVDDTKMNIKVFCALLKKTQIDITCAYSGKEALSYIEKEKFDLIFMDHLMPEMDGIETLHTMKNMENHPNKDTKVIILTANAISGAREMYQQEGFDGVLFKPVEGKALEATLREFLGL